MKITTIGCGRWGTFITWYLDSIGHTITLYGRESSANMQELIETRQNSILEIPQSITLTTDISCVDDSEVLILSINSQGLRALCAQLAQRGLKNTIVVLCMKGIEIETGERLSQIASGILDSSNDVAVWLGPGHVQEFYKGIPNCMVIDSENAKVKETLVDSFSSDLIRFYYGQDLIGNEIGAAAKNVIGIAAGMLDGLHLSTLKGALMSRGAREIARLISAVGGNELSAYGLCHLGDYEATVFSKFSQNRLYGEKFAQKQTYDKLAEGYYTVKALVKMAEKYGVDLPICSVVYSVLYENIDFANALDTLFNRSLKTEW